jgi:predicted molibdopterin-dependent oxidoreductase YjgC
MKVILDGAAVEVDGKATILEVARRRGVYIPTLCDHGRLAPHTACRLCIVAIKGRRGVAPACGTWVEEGMDITTRTPEIDRMRRQILELLLSEHPSACLVCSEKKTCVDYKCTIRKVGEVTGCVLCPNDGRCELQTVVEKLQIETVHFPAFYRNEPVHREDPFFERNMNLCILCGRCVRICHEVRGASTLAFLNRGSRTVVGTALEKPLLESGCQFCGACVDACPTGALFEKGVKYEPRPDCEKPMICGFCSQGCALLLELREGRIQASPPAEDGPVNRGQACVRGRFLVRQAVYHPKRVLRPLIRKDGVLTESSWEEALGLVAERLAAAKPGEIAALGSAQSSCEDTYAFRKFVRDGLKAARVAGPEAFSPQARLLALGGDQGFVPALNYAIADIGKAKAILTFGPVLPMVGLEIQGAVRSGAKLVVVGGPETPLVRCTRAWVKIPPGTEGLLLAALSRILGDEGAFAEGPALPGSAEFKKLLREVRPAEAAHVAGLSQDKLQSLAQLLEKRRPAAFVFGPAFGEGPGGPGNLAALWNLALQTRGLLAPLGYESNARGALAIANAVGGLSVDEAEAIYRSIPDGGFPVLYLAGPAPEFAARPAGFVVVQDSYLGGNAEFADVVLPAATFPESGGTFVNVEGRLQGLGPAVEPLGESRPGWRIVRDLARAIGLPGFEFSGPADVLAELSVAAPAFRSDDRRPLAGGDFLREPDATPPAFAVRPAPAGGPAPRFEHNDDRYQGLAMDREIRGLALIRGNK